MKKMNNKPPKKGKFNQKELAFLSTTSSKIDIFQLALFLERSPDSIKKKIKSLKKLKPAK